MAEALLAGRTASSSHEGAGPPTDDKKDDDPVHAEAVDHTAAVYDAECTCETDSSESTNADLDVTQPVTEDMKLAPGTMVSCHAREVGWIGGK
eukprot:9020807-Pyramimonas_sp.AAC.1